MHCRRFLLLIDGQSVSLIGHSGSFLKALQLAARQHNIYISAGVHEAINGDESKMYNSHMVINNEGKVVATQRKIHLFDIVRFASMCHAKSSI